MLRGGDAVSLTPRIFDTLLYFAMHPGRVIPKEELMRAIWPDVAVEENNLNQNISALRRVLGESPGDNRFIVTVPGRGYRFVADVKSIGVAPATSLGVSRRKSIGRIALLTAVFIGALGISLAMWRDRTLLRSSPLKTIAVLPFKPLLVENRDPSLEIGMADTLIAKLSKIRGLTVHPLSAMRKYGGQEQDPFSAGRELGVEAVLDGYIQRSDDRIRITTRLVSVSDQKQLWAGQFDEPARDIFAVQDSISEKVARELALELTGEDRKRIAKRDTDDPKAYELYLKGRLFLAQSRPGQIGQAIGFFEDAIRIDPNYALAYTGIADAYSRMPIAGDVPSFDAFSKATQATLKALDIDGELVEAHASLAWIKLWYEWDWKVAEREFRLALDGNPSYTFARAGLAHLLSDLGRHKEAINEIDQALKLDPISVHAGTMKGHFLYQARRYPEAVDQLLRTIELEPNYWIAHITLGKVYERAGQHAQALAAFQKAGNLGGASSEPLALTGYVYAASGRRAEAESTLRELEATSKLKYVPPWYIALMHQGLGNSNEAIKWLARAYDEKDVHMVFLGSDPKWDPMRKNPAFISLLNRMRLD